MDYPLHSDSYHGTNGSLHEELVYILSHNWPIYKHYNTSFYTNIKNSEMVTSVESNVKAISHRKDCRGGFFALVFNRTGDTKYCAILNNCMNLLQNIKCNWHSYPLETHVTNHRQEVEDLQECATHITTSVPDQGQRVDYQSAIGLLRANTNNARHDFESAISKLIEVDPYKRYQELPCVPGSRSSISDVDFSGGRVSSRLYIHWHHQKEFKKLFKYKKGDFLLGA